MCYQILGVGDGCAVILYCLLYVFQGVVEDRFVVVDEFLDFVYYVLDLFGYDFDLYGFDSDMWVVFDWFVGLVGVDFYVFFIEQIYGCDVKGCVILQCGSQIGFDTECDVYLYWVFDCFVYLVVQEVDCFDLFGIHICDFDYCIWFEVVVRLLVYCYVV